MITQESVEQRKPVWLALSEFYLDTELEDADYYRIAAVLRGSRVSLTEAREINVLEVAPAVMANLFSTAGAWAGFDEEWLYQRIVEKIKTGPPRLLLSKWLWRGLVRIETRCHFDKLQPYFLDR